MSMTKDAIRKFVEEDYKDFVIMVTCDNEHKFYHNASKNPSIVWDWDNDLFLALDINDEPIDQNKHPMQVTQVSLEEIQFLDAFIDKEAALKFISEKYTDDEDKAVAKAILQKAAPGVMGTRTLRKHIDDPEFRA